MRAIALLIGLPLLAQALPHGEDLLAAADRLRHPFPSFSVDVTLKDRKGEQHWRVRARENGDARVEGLSEKEKGRAVLVKGDDLWLLLPNTKRPLKVSPQQRLLGPASGGDLARTRFKDDYAVESLRADAIEGREVWLLDLKAKRPALTFQRARLTVDRADHAPLRAEFLFASGKVAKTVRFIPGGQAGSHPALRAMDITDPDGATATISFSNWIQGTHDDALFELPATK
jgi:outer membrane lipoprotein-sorting protein